MISEPTVSMGDWRKPRRGLTARERGIPLHLFRQLLASTGFTIVSEKRYMFSVLIGVSTYLGVSVFSHVPLLLLDEMFCRVFSWNTVYHPANLIEKLCTTHVFYVVTKPTNEGRPWTAREDDKPSEPPAASDISGSRPVVDLRRFFRARLGLRPLGSCGVRGNR